jgi:hypothetical protein
MTKGAPTLGLHEPEIAKERRQRMITILVILLVLALVGSLPAWPYSRGWGYYPSGGVGLIVLILVILLLMGYIRF